MLIFIDESGDPGFKITEGSSQHFVIALIIFQNELDAEETAVAIKKMRKVQKHTDQFEYKFNKCDRKHRLSFLKCVQPFNFAIRAIVFDKTNIKSQHLRTKKEDFYRFALRMVLEHNYGTIKNAKIRLDGRGDHSFRRQLTTYLRQHLNSSTQHVISNLRFRDSKQDVLIQLADMVAGSLRRYFDHTQEDWGIYRKVLISKENDVWEFT
jgi:hypothetical protein